MAKTDVSSLRAGVVINCLFPTKSCFLLSGLWETVKPPFVHAACVWEPDEDRAAVLGGLHPPHLLCFQRPLACELSLGS